MDIEFRLIWHLITSGDLNIDFNADLTEILSVMIPDELSNAFFLFPATLSGS